MTVNGRCPSCGCYQSENLLCHEETSAVEGDLKSVVVLVAELDVTLAKQAQMERASKGGLARERTQMDTGASLAASSLTNTLTTWARDVVGESITTAFVSRDRDSQSAGPYCLDCKHPTCRAMRVTRVVDAPPAVVAAHALLSDITAIRKHPAADEIRDQIAYAVEQGWAAVDRAANRTRFPVGPCPEEDEHGVPCDGEVFAFIPTEDDRPSRMECRANPDHRWGSIQWMRTGKRILDTVEKRKRSA